ncbi:alpha/beta hydrolase-fold protein [Prolixibacteraceae bacterium Z1-6]|uniref:Alpha/beta hydrolase-fold protein n=1 Tax=Draconibacterium aestuarii TaxID=2998507 RepID=A0A9X3FI59_9BACT|nr:alpha/beta hydrolase-fold protein [Prolixibacteraceae bacterium Z1-6]
MANQIFIQLKRSTFLVISIFLLFAGNLIAQTKTELVTAVEFTLQSKVLNEERVISVFLPNNYVVSTDKYPVLYLLDGRTHFQHAISAASYLSGRVIIPNLVIVSIHNVDRNRDFSPVYSEKIPTSGGADKFLEFLSEELSVYMKKHYRISDFSVLLGHSFGGTFIAYSLVEKPDLFDGFIAVSPYLQYADNYMVTQTREKLNLNNTGKKYLYMTVGDEPNYFEPLKQYTQLMEQQSADNIQFKYVKMENENHGTTPYLTLFNGLRFIFSDWIVPRDLISRDIPEIDEHFSKLSEKYGISIHTPENVINTLGYTKLQGGDINGAILIFKENVKRYPKSANVYDSLGEAYENNKQVELARKNYEKACTLGAAALDPNLIVYMKNLERVKGM